MMFERFMPHGMCFAWQKDVLTLHVVSDALIALAYFSIPALLAWFARRRADLPFSGVAWLFGTFIVACGTTHLMAIWTIWHPDYWADGAIKAVTAVASVGTALALVPLLPRALALRSPSELERVNAELERTLHDLAREHRIATTLQTASLASALPEVDGLRFSADYTPAAADLEIGGDWYDAFPLADGRVAVTVGDVTGSGLDASVIMAKVRQSLRAASFIQVDPAAILDAADRALRTEYPDRVVSAFVGIVDRIEWTFTYAGAGHPWPLLRRADGTIEELRTIALPLGLRDRAAPAAQTVALATGDTLVLFTDGLTEATHDLAEGERLLRRALTALDASALQPALALRRAVLREEAHDDIAVLTMSVVPLTGASLLRHTFASDDGAAAGRARNEITAALRGAGGTDEDAIAAELVFSELVGNVYRYAAGTVEVILDTSGVRPVLHVLDGGRGFQHISKLPSDLFAERGRGLFLVASLTEDFHINKRAGGGSHARAVLSLHVPAVALRRVTDGGALAPALGGF